MTGRLAAFLDALDEATRVGLAGATAGALSGLFASAFVLGALWALRGRPALRAPECRRCASLLRVDEPSGAPRLPEACPECGERCDRVGSVRWFRYRRQAATLGVTLPVVLVGGLVLSGIATAVVMRLLVEGSRPIRHLHGAAAPRTPTIYDHGLEDPDSFEEVIARLDVVEIARRLACVEAEIDDRRSAETVIPGLRRLREALLRGEAVRAGETTPDRALVLRYATVEAVDSTLGRFGALSAREIAEGESRLIGTYRLTGPRRVLIGARIVLRLAPPVLDLAAEERWETLGLRVELDGDEVPWQPEHSCQRGTFSLVAPYVVGEHAISVTFGGGELGDEHRRTLRVEVVEDAPTLEPIVDEAFEVATALLSERLRGVRRDAWLRVELQPVGRRWLLQIHNATSCASPILHGELVLEGAGERFVIETGPDLGEARLGPVQTRVPEAPRVLRMAYRPASLDDRPPHPFDVSIGRLGVGDAAHPGWWGRAFGLELTAQHTDSRGLTSYAPTRALTPEEIAEILNPAEPTRPDGPDPSS